MNEKVKAITRQAEVQMKYGDLFELITRIMVVMTNNSLIGDISHREQTGITLIRQHDSSNCYE